MTLPVKIHSPKFMLAERLVGVELDDFRACILEIQDSPRSPANRVFLLALIFMLSSALLWSCLAGIDEFATAPGRIVPTGRSKIVQAFETAKVQEVLVANGDHVEAGAPLIRLDPTEADADVATKLYALHTIDAQIARRGAAIEAIKSDRAQATPNFSSDIPLAIRVQETVAMQADIADYFTIRDQLIAKRDESIATSQRFVLSIAARQRLIALLTERTGMKQKLVANSSGTLSDLLDIEQKLEQANGDLAYDQGQLGEAKATEITGERNVEQNKSKALAEQAQALATALEKRNPAVQDVAQAQLRQRRATLTSPVNGTVQQIAATTIGQVVTAGQQLVTVVPSDVPLIIEAYVPNKEVRSVVSGEETVIKVDAFPFTQYGTIDGKVTDVSRDAIDTQQVNPTATNSGASSDGPKDAGGLSKLPETVYPVDIHMARSTINVGGKDVGLLPGMTVTVDIRTSRRRIISYLIAPVMETLTSAGHER